MAQPLPKNLSDIEGRANLIVAINSYHCLVEKKHRLEFLKNISRIAKKDSPRLYLSTMCQPLATGHKPPKTPRVYLELEEILGELALEGWSELLAKDWTLPHDRQKISNLSVLMGRKG